MQVQNTVIFLISMFYLNWLCFLVKVNISYISAIISLLNAESISLKIASIVTKTKENGLFTKETIVAPGASWSYRFGKPKPVSSMYERRFHHCNLSCS